MNDADSTPCNAHLLVKCSVSPTVSDSCETVADSYSPPAFGVAGSPNTVGFARFDEPSVCKKAVGFR